MRVKKSFYNVMANIIVLFSKTILSFITRTFFIKILGKELLGLDGLFISIISMLSLAELGISSAINFCMYEPLANHDTKKLNALISFNKKVYFVIGIMIFTIGLILMPFIPSIVNKSFDNLLLIYLLYLLDSATSYFITYKEELIIADQNGYKLGAFDTVFSFLLYGFQILFLILTKNFIIYLIISILIKFIQKVVKNIYITKKYPYVDFKSDEKIDKKTKNKIITNVKSLILHRIGNYLLNGTDNIIISTISIGLVGIYANYLSIVSIFQTFTNSIYNGILASFGNLIVKENKETQENVFNITNFICFVFCGWICLELMFLFNPFIELWIGKKYLLPLWITIIISINFYLYSSMTAMDVVKKASGKYDIDKFIPLIQSIINILVSIVLGNMIGIGGVILGTLVSYLTIRLIFEPVIIYKKIFNKNAFNYYIRQLKNIILMAVCFIICTTAFNSLSFEVGLYQIFIKGLIVALVYMCLIIVFYHRTNEFDYFKKMLSKKK